MDRSGHFVANIRKSYEVFCQPHLGIHSINNVAFILRCFCVCRLCFLHLFCIRFLWLRFVCVSFCVGFAYFSGPDQYIKGIQKYVKTWTNGVLPISVTKIGKEGTCSLVPQEHCVAQVYIAKVIPKKPLPNHGLVGGARHCVFLIPGGSLGLGFRGWGLTLGLAWRGLGIAGSLCLRLVSSVEGTNSVLVAASVASQRTDPPL